MSHDVTYTTKAVMPARNTYPSFGTPIYSTAANSEYYFQSYNKENIVTGFNSLTIDPNLCFHWGIEERTIRRGDSAIFAFYSRNRKVILGNHKELIVKLKKEFPSLNEFPFVQLQVAKFIGSTRLIRECEGRTRKILEGNDPLPYSVIYKHATQLLDGLPKVTLNDFPVYRLVKRTIIEPAQLFSVDNEFNGLEELPIDLSPLDNPRTPPLNKKHPSWIYNMFRYRLPSGTIFSERDTPAVVCGLSINDCIRALKRDHRHFFDAGSFRSSVNYSVGKLYISGDFYDARHINIGDSRINREIYQSTGSQIYQRKEHGILFKETQHSDGGICFFSPGCINRSEMVGAVTIDFDEAPDIT